ncbi:hypothetical protein GCM10023194_74310 [Planotetraspora phitsanulokensis]|uniref:Uncharacterized protein n=1 Tax=Planotetraspora phitsanulokensis TaxID=575192 RepID=A0A8J3XDW6_9ACTN|nr:hypothetical protein Pph01_20720 [Planotetraspora phitsanulokensis]
MSTLPLIIALVLAGGVLVGYIAVLVGIKREDKAMSLTSAPDGQSARLARHVTGLHIRGGGPTGRIAPKASTRPGRAVPTSPVRRCAVR